MKRFYFLAFFVIITVLVSSCSSTASIQCDSDREIKITQTNGYGSTSYIHPGQKSPVDFYGYGDGDDRVVVRLRIGYLPLQTATERAFMKLSRNIKKKSKIASGFTG
jgi:hypothetical protein